MINNQGTVSVDNPSKMPNAGEIEEILEPWVKLGIVTPSTYIGTLMELTKARRGTFLEMEYLDPKRVLLNSSCRSAKSSSILRPLKTRTQGYASMDFEEIGYRAANLVKVDVLVAGEPVDALSVIVHRDRAPGDRPRAGPQASRPHPAPDVRDRRPGRIGSNVIARESVAAMRKNVLAKCYGGDITRKAQAARKSKKRASSA